MKSACLTLVMAAACTLTASLPARADYPERPVRLIVPFPPGGSTEPLARLLSQKLADSLT